MGKYNGAVITTAGQNLIAQAIAESKTVTFTTAQASSHVYPSSTDFEALTALTDVEKTVDINYAGVYSDTVVQVSARFDNTNVETAYLINTLGFFAQIGTGTPILFAVCTAVTPDQMPVFDADNPSAFIYNMQMTVQNADSINLSVNPAGTVTVDQLNAAVSTINASIGDLSDLTTDNKTSLVNAINEVNTKVVKTSVLISNSGDAYSPSRPYKVGDLCIHNNVLYRCITACSAGSWATNQSCFTADTLVNVGNVLNDNMIPSTLPITNISTDFSGFITCVKICGMAIVNIYGNLSNMSHEKTIATGLPRPKETRETRCVTDEFEGVSPSVLEINANGILYVVSQGTSGPMHALTIYRYI